MYSFLPLRLLGFLLICDVSQVFSEIYFKKGSPHVKLNDNAVLSGSIQLSREGRPFSAFLGIPYATIPGRFQESQLISAPAWDGVKSFTEPGPICLQKYFDGSNRGAETCLSLNVYVPMNNTGDKQGYPVMVWIHGGGYMLGSGYGNNPKYILDEDVILLNFNYRLGVFGFLSLEDNVVPGNNGLKDMRTLLVWVQQNIAKFGGNPNKVTIFGESAGANDLGLGEPSARENAIQLATHLKCPTTAMKPSDITSKEILACLSNMSGEELNQAQFEYRQCWPQHVRPFFFLPSVEPEGTPNAFLTESPILILEDKTRTLREVPWLLGATEDEGGTMYAGVVVERAGLLNQMNAEWDKIAPVAFDYGKYPLSQDAVQTISKKLRQFYFGSETEPITLEKHRKNLTDLFSDQLINHSVHKAAVQTASIANNKAPVYLYQYAYQGPLSIMGLIFKLHGPETKRVSHADDLQHLFDLSEELFPGASNAIKRDTPDEEFSKNLVRLWVSFAVHGEPKHYWGTRSTKTLEEEIEWKPLSKEEVDGTLPMKWWRLDSNPGYIEEPYKERMKFWDDLFEAHFIPALKERFASTANAKTEL